MDFLSYCDYDGYAFIMLMYRLHPPAKRLFCVILTVDLISQIFIVCNMGGVMPSLNAEMVELVVT